MKYDKMGTVLCRCRVREGWGRVSCGGVMGVARVGVNLGVLEGYAHYTE